MAEKRWGVNNSTVVFLADFIRSVLGTTGPIPGAQLDPQLREAVAKVESGGGGSGGGSLPAGVYLSAFPINRAIQYRHRLFFLNGELYATGSGIAGAGYLSKIYKWNGSSWDNLLSATGSTGINGTAVDCVGYKAVEYNGKMHFFDMTNHASFDGTSLTVHNKAPSEVESVAVYQGKLFVKLSTDKSLYEWDEAADTFASVASIASSKYTTVDLFTIAGSLYFVEGKNIYLYEDGVKTQVNAATLTSFTGVRSFVYAGCIYWIDSQSTYAYLYRYNPNTDECALVGNLPPFQYYWVTPGGENLSFVGATYSGDNSRYPEFLLTIVEATE